MNSFRERFSTTGLVNQLRQARRLDDEEDTISDTAWGSQAGFGNLVKGSPSFLVPAVPDVSF
jgi:20S proteasome subunit beta 5